MEDGYQESMIAGISFVDLSAACDTLNSPETVEDKTLYIYTASPIKQEDYMWSWNNED